MRDYIKDSLWLIALFIFGFIIVSIFLIFIMWIISQYPDIDFFFKGNELSDNIIRLHAAALIILTIVLICVAWLQLSNLNKTSRADFLLRIDDRYGRSEIIKARAIIQELYRRTEPNDETTSKEEYIEKISNQIKIIGKSDLQEQCEKFSYLLNLLDYLETISYFANKNYISLKEVDELVGCSMIFYYKIFEQWIKYRRTKYNNSSYYCEFVTVIEKIRTINLKNCQKYKKN